MLGMLSCKKNHRKINKNNRKTRTRTIVSLIGFTMLDITLTRSWRFWNYEGKKKDNDHIRFKLNVVGIRGDNLSLLNLQLTMKLGRQNGRLFRWTKCRWVSMDTKLWKLLLWFALCMPSLILQWPAIIFSFLAAAHDCKTGLLKHLFH